MEKPIIDVIEDFKKLFNVSNSNLLSYEHDGVFHIGKTDMSRLKVLDELGKYFNGVTIKGGFVEVDNITFIHTVVRVKKGHPTNNQERK